LPPDPQVWGGLALGLALATKASALFALPALLFLPRRRALAAAAVALGAALGDPTLLLPAREAITGLFHQTGAGGPLDALEMLVFQGWQIAYYGLGVVGLAAALAGLRRARRGTRWALAALFLSLGLSRIPVARYALPLLPVLAVEAGVMFAAVPLRWRLPAAAAALLPPLVLAAGQAGLLAGEHTAQRAGDWIAEHAPPGATVAQVWPEYPLLDARHVVPVPLYTRSTAPAGEPGLAADFVVLDGLRLEPFTAGTRDALARGYEEVASFTRPPHLGPLVLPEPWPAHDWKYTHPALEVWRRVR